MFEISGKIKSLFAIGTKRRINKIISSLENHNLVIHDQNNIKTIITNLSRLYNNKLRLLRIVKSHTDIINVKKTKESSLKILSKQLEFLNELENLLKKIDLDFLEDFNKLPRYFFTAEEQEINVGLISDLNKLRSITGAYKHSINAQISELGRWAGIEYFKKQSFNMGVSHEKYFLWEFNRYYKDFFDKSDSERKILEDKVRIIKYVIGIYYEHEREIIKARESIRELLGNREFADSGKPHFAINLYRHIGLNLSPYKSWLQNLKEKIINLELEIRKLSEHSNYTLILQYYSKEIKALQEELKKYKDLFPGFKEVKGAIENAIRAYRSKDQSLIKSFPPPFVLSPSASVDVTGKYSALYHGVSFQKHDWGRSWQKREGRITAGEYVERIKTIMIEGLKPAESRDQVYSDRFFKAIYFFSELNFQYGPMVISINPSPYAVFSESTFFSGSDEKWIYADNIPISVGQFRLIFKMEKDSWHSEVIRLLQTENTNIEIV